MSENINISFFPDSAKSSESRITALEEFIPQLCGRLEFCFDNIGQEQENKTAGNNSGINIISPDDYATKITFGESGFTIAFVSQGKTATNDFTVTKDSSGRITAIKNDANGRELEISYE